MSPEEYLGEPEPHTLFDQMMKDAYVVAIAALFVILVFIPVLVLILCDKVSCMFHLDDCRDHSVPRL